MIQIGQQEKKKESSNDHRAGLHDHKVPLKDGFFESFVNQRFDFEVPSEEVLTKWDEMKLSADAYALMLVKTNSASVNNYCQQHEGQSGNLNYFQVVLCQDLLFLLQVAPNAPQGLTESEEDLLMAQYTNPLFYVSIEFTKLKIIKSKSGRKIGFSLSLKESSHQLIIKLSNSKQASESCNSSMRHMAKSPRGISDRYDMSPDELQATFKMWMQALNQWVVRSENLKKFHVLEQIGAGGQAKVYKIVNKKGNSERVEYSSKNGEDKQSNNEEEKEKVLAIKVINKDRLINRDAYEQKQMINEIRIQRSLKYCGNTIKLFKIYESEKYINLVQELQEGGTLGELLEKQVPLKEEDARIIIEQLLLAVDFMNCKNIIHRDIKPENILLNSKKQGQYDIRIADFGFATTLNADFTAKRIDEQFVCGTAGYMAPEIIEGRGLSIKSDIFSVGVILYNVLTLKNLFGGRTYKDVMDQNKKCNFSNLELKMKNCSKISIHLVKQLLQKDPAFRPTAQEALKHPWFLDEQSPLRSSMNLNRILNVQSGHTSFYKMQADIHHIVQQSSVGHATPTAQNSLRINQLNGIINQISDISIGQLKQSCVAEYEPLMSNGNLISQSNGQRSFQRNGQYEAGRSQERNISLQQRFDPNQSQMFYRHISRDKSQEDGYSDFRGRPEIMSQFNYYRIISEFKRDKILMQENIQNTSQLPQLLQVNSQFNNAMDDRTPPRKDMPLPSSHGIQHPAFGSGSNIPPQSIRHESNETSKRNANKQVAPPQVNNNFYDTVQKFDFYMNSRKGPPSKFDQYEEEKIPPQQINPPAPMLLNIQLQNPVFFQKDTLNPLAYVEDRVPRILEAPHADRSQVDERQLLNVRNDNSEAPPVMISGNQKQIFHQFTFDQGINEQEVPMEQIHSKIVYKMQQKQSQIGSGAQNQQRMHNPKKFLKDLNVQRVRRVFL